MIFLERIEIKLIWFLFCFAGSISFICQPIGSILSGYMTDPLGRKKAMFIVNFPHVIAWFLMYKATAVWHIFVANVLLGLGIGLGMEYSINE